MKKKICFLLILLAATLTGCASTKTQDVFRFEAHEVNLIVGEEMNLKIIFGSVNENEEIVYVIGDSDLIKYEDEKLTALAVGTTKLTAYVKDSPLTRASVNITISNKTLSSLKINGVDTLLIGETKVFTTEVTPSDISSNVTWKSSNVKVATVDASGKVSAIKAGNVVISATSKYDSTIVAKKALEVKYHDATSIDITIVSGGINLTIGATAQLKATVSPILANPEYTWTTSDAKIVTIDETGKITAVAAGSAKIVATSADNLVQKEIDITVVWADATNITVNSVTTDIYVNDTFKVEATVEPANANPDFIISVDKEDLVQINNDVITFVAAGTVEVTVKSADGKVEQKMSIVINPIPDPTGIELKTEDGETTYDEKQSNIALVITISPEHALQEYDITTSDETVATVTAKGNGYVLNTKNPGTVTITVTSKVNPTLNASIVITVNAIE